MITITFVIPGSIDYNGGIEKTISRYNAFETGDFEKSVLQGVSGFHGQNLYEIKSLYSRLIIRTSGKLNFAVRLGAPIILQFDRLMNLKILRYIEKNSRIIYLTNNDYYYLFRHDSFFIWSEHGNIPSNYTGIRILNNATSGLIKKHLLFRKIKAIHLINSYNLKAVPFKNSFCVPNGVDSDSFFPEERKHSAIRLLFVGRLEKSKGIDKIVNVFQKNNLNMELTVVGSGEMENLFSHPIQNVAYLKNISDEDLAKIYRESDVFIFPSTLENFGNVVLEALSSGLFVIASESLKPRFDDIEKMNFLEYVENSEISILKALRGIEKKIEYTGIYGNKIIMHNYIAEKYGWNNILDKFYNEIKNIYQKAK
jgi:glycosyltransferase involved in cell wall biosynthesis